VNQYKSEKPNIAGKNPMLDRIMTLMKANKELSLLGFASIIILIFGVLTQTRSEPQTASSKPLESFDTYIPAGHSLVPIEVANYETLDSLLGPFGVVDLFTAEPGHPESSKRIAYRVKILRAPRNPSHFAVLVPFEQAAKILRFPGPFLVSVQNPKSVGTVFEKEKRGKRNRIIFSTGE